MWAGKKNLHRVFARVSPVFAALLFLISCASATAENESGVRSSPNTKRQAATSQFAKAEEQRIALDAKPSDKRTLAEYKQIVGSYRRVYLITPHAAEAPDSLLAIAELYAEMGNRFGQHYYQMSVDAYRFLMKEYPTSKYGQDAILRVAQLQKGPLGDRVAAAETYEEFLKKYPRSPHRREVQESLVELALLRDSDIAVPAKSAPSESARVAAPVPEVSRARAPETRSMSKTSGGAAAADGVVPRVRRITASVSPDYTRVIIDLEDSVQYSSARIRNPDRIFFDLRAARLMPKMARENIRAEGPLLTGVRVAQNHAGVVRVVFDVNGVQEYSASLLNHPARLVIDFYGEGRSAAPLRTTNGKRAPLQRPTARASTDTDAAAATGKTVDETLTTPAAIPAAKVVMVGPPNPGNEAGAERVAAENSALAPGAKSRSKPAKSAMLKPDLIQPSVPAQPTRDGQATLTRTLGLKISRIVIDAGHGGHDTGTIGPSGLMEKDLCLDVALRLGKIIQQRLPAAEVVYTRADDTFIPLEDRTRVANAARADLFISIHANSSRDHAARGVETYYLNLKGSADSMEVAARENATSQQSIHDLEDLVKRIARSEKIEESREFAADVQESLTKRILRTSKKEKDRGVRKAPFVVLIGADMPSILTEISFLSNPADEKLLKKPEHRQRVAEGLYQGMASYLQNLNSVTLNMPVKGSGRPAAVASVEQSRSQQ